MDWDGRVLESEYFDYEGEVALCKGASSQETSAANTQNQLAQTLLQNYQTQFGNQSAILSAINSAWSPVLKAGPNQYGFSAAEDAALRTQATTGTAQQYANAKKAVGENLAAVGGGNTFLPSSTGAGIQAGIATSAAGQEASQQLGITQAGYATGRQNFLDASSALSGTAQMYNPLGYSGQASSANQNAFEDFNTINQENQAASPWGAIGGILGGVAGSFLGPIGTALGSKVSSALGKAT